MRPADEICCKYVGYKEPPFTYSEIISILSEDPKNKYIHAFYDICYYGSGEPTSSNIRLSDFGYDCVQGMLPKPNMITYYRSVKIRTYVDKYNTEVKVGSKVLVKTYTDISDIVFHYNTIYDIKINNDRLARKKDLVFDVSFSGKTYGLDLRGCLITSIITQQDTPYIVDTNPIQYDDSEKMTISITCDVVNEFE